MASNYTFVILAIFAILLPATAVAKEYIVGGDSGWTVNYDYQAWAKDKEFHVNDTLVFKYTPPNHNVFKVNGTEFNNCTVPSSNSALSSGNDVITLSTPGNKWYICGKGNGDKNHCQLGQKLSITVKEGAAPSAAFKIVSSASSLMVVAVMVLVTLI
ncbi:mavicyanin-like [Pistacia vera]|uniref:Uncharacterized protein n=1 Tax=Pistacia integerrima TaxID=434235 RepID=A0ACC0X9T3_9ROSI|nr:mavicyanin-like [Pistacia vera]KAJ0013990.1 hypothetical protein Pint_20058 [Pistacia integerrima]